MKLTRFTTADSPNPIFGVLIRDQAVPFSVLQSKAGKSFLPLADSRSYLANLPDSERAAKEVFAWLGFIAPIQSGSVVGFGTIPDCTGSDHDNFIDPGADIQITFERLGTLRCRFAEPTGKLLPSRWPVREPLQKYHE
jgi:hypothetical protein